MAISPSKDDNRLLLFLEPKQWDGPRAWLNDGILAFDAGMRSNEYIEVLTLGPQTLRSWWRLQQPRSVSFFIILSRSCFFAAEGYEILFLSFFILVLPALDSC